MNTMTIAQHREFVKLAVAHQKADEYIAGRYKWKNGACAVGCSVRDAKKLKLLPRSIKPGDHAALATATGVPELAWHMADCIFEGLPQDERSDWVPRFIRAAKPNRKGYATFPARVSARLMRKLEAEALTAEVKAVAGVVAALWTRCSCGYEPSVSEWDAAWQQADAARRQADAARWQADAARQQADAARRQVLAARQQADAARQQALAAWQQADAARRQAHAAWQQFWRDAANIVIEELEASN